MIFKRIIIIYFYYYFINIVIIIIKSNLIEIIKQLKGLQINIFSSKQFQFDTCTKFSL